MVDDQARSDGPHCRPAFTVRLGGAFVPFIVNDDRDELTEEEIRDFDAYAEWIRDQAPEGFVFSHWDCDGETMEFAECEVTGLHGPCVDVLAIFEESENA